MLQGGTHPSASIYNRANGSITPLHAPTAAGSLMRRRMCYCCCTAVSMAQAGRQTTFHS